MKKPLLIGLAAILFLGAGIGILAAELKANKAVNSNSVADASSSCAQKYKKYSDSYNSCIYGYTEISVFGVKTAADDSKYNSALKNSCPSGPNQSACAYGASKYFASIQHSSTSSSGGSSSHSSGSTHQATHTTTTTHSAPASHSTPAPSHPSTVAAAATNTGPTSDAAATLNDTECGSGGVKVSKVWGLPGDCLGGSSINPIFALIAYVISYASGVLGLLMVLMIIIAGLQYVLSGANPDVAKAAKDRIRNAFTGFVLFVLMFAIIQLILPSNARIFNLG